MRRLLFYLLLITLFCTAQRSKDGYHNLFLAKENAVHKKLSSGLKEISGLAISNDGRLFAHNDEEGKIFQIDPNDGSIVKVFSLKKKADFEGIAIVGETFYLVTSDGTIYCFREGKKNETVSFTAYPTSLTKYHDVEGLCYDPNSHSLLLACKRYSGMRTVGYKAVFSFSLESLTLSPSPRFLLSVKELEKKLGSRSFNPSGIEFNAVTGTFYILDSGIRSVVEISPDGHIINTVMLDRALHKQPEGITIGPDGSLYISDEGSKHGSLTIYRRKQ